MNQTLENSTSLSGEIKGAFLTAIGNAESYAGEDAWEDEFGFSPFSMSTQQIRFGCNGFFFMPDFYKLNHT